MLVTDPFWENDTAWSYYVKPNGKDLAYILYICCI